LHLIKTTRKKGVLEKEKRLRVGKQEKDVRKQAKIGSSISSTLAKHTHPHIFM
jgi:hypothetical protein